MNDRRTGNGKQLTLALAAVTATVDGWALRATIPPSFTLPVKTGLNGSRTSYCRSSPVPQHDT